MKRSGSIGRNDLRSGFVLIEVLAAVALTAAFAAVVLPFAGRLVEQWQRGEAVIQDADAWMQLTARLATDLAQAVPLPGPTERQRVLMFRASSDSLVFVRPSRASGEPGGLRISAYMVERTRSGDVLVNYSTGFSPALMDVDPRSFGAATAVMTGPFRFAFVAVGEDGSRPEIWSGRNDLPSRIELTAVPIAGKAAPTVPIVLPIAAQAPKNAAPPQTTSR